MKFYAATTTCPIELRNVSNPDETREFPGGTEVTATPMPVGSDHYHLNANGGAGTWDTWEGYTSRWNLVIGEVIATANEGK